MMTFSLKNKKSSIIALLLLGSYSAVFSQRKLTKEQWNGSNSLNTITTAVPFLLITPDSRAGGLGDAGVATSADANSMHWNASKLAFAEKKFGIGVSYTPWLRALVPDINLAYLSGYYKLKKDQAVGASLRYFSLGDITFTDNVGNVTGNFRPSEYALDVGYARKLGDNFSAAMAARYIFSNLTGGIFVAGAQTKPGQSFSVDISGFYNKELKVAAKKSTLSVGLNISNIGAKISYSETAKQDFLPINMRLGSSLTMQMDDYNSLSFILDFTKLLVPTPPVYLIDAFNQPVKNSLGEPVIQLGQDPNRGVTEGILGSFSDAPGGFQEELKEINISGGLEYWYDKQFAVRAGYFYESPIKGNRKYITLGAGLKYSVFNLDFAYLIPTQQRNPLENTLRFSLLFNFDELKGNDEPQAE